MLLDEPCSRLPPRFVRRVMTAQDAPEAARRQDCHAQGAFHGWIVCARLVSCVMWSFGGRGLTLANAPALAGCAWRCVCSRQQVTPKRAKTPAKVGEALASHALCMCVCLGFMSHFEPASAALVFVPSLACVLLSSAQDEEDRRGQGQEVKGRG
jgi:hypothetical protein